MTQWWSLSLGDAILAFTSSEHIKDAFRDLHTVRPAVGAAVFTSRDAGDLHCHVTAYFTPACAELATQLGAVPCAAPARAGLELLAGEPACWDVVFATR